MGMSPETAAWVSDWANIVLIVSLIVGVVSTYLVVISGNVKEADLKRQVAVANAEAARANESGAELRRQTAGLEREAAKANEAAATANERAATLTKETFELRQKMAWRRITEAQFRAIVTALKGQKLSVWVSFVGSDPESSVYREDIATALKAAGLETKYFSGWEKAVGLAIADEPEGPERDALIKAFALAGIPLASTKSQMAKGQLQIIVGTKPPPF